MSKGSLYGVLETISLSRGFDCLLSCLVLQLENKKKSRFFYLKNKTATNLTNIQRCWEKITQEAVGGKHWKLIRRKQDPERTVFEKSKFRYLKTLSCLDGRVSVQLSKKSSMMRLTRGFHLINVAEFYTIVYVYMYDHYRQCRNRNTYCRRRRCRALG